MIDNGTFIGTISGIILLVLLGIWATSSKKSGNSKSNNSNPQNLKFQNILVGNLGPANKSNVTSLNSINNNTNSPWRRLKRFLGLEKKFIPM